MKRFALPQSLGDFRALTHRLATTPSSFPHAFYEARALEILAASIASAQNQRRKRQLQAQATLLMNGSHIVDVHAQRERTIAFRRVAQDTTGPREHRVLFGNEDHAASVLMFGGVVVGLPAPTKTLLVDTLLSLFVPPRANRLKQRRNARLKRFDLTRTPITQKGPAHLLGLF